MSKHTPGPWSVGSLPPAAWRYISDDNGDTVAAVAEWDDDGDLQQEFQGEAALHNARLIAAAPEMLEALKLMLDLVGADADTRASVKVKAIAAVQKAEGRT